MQSVLNRSAVAPSVRPVEGSTRAQRVVCPAVQKQTKEAATSTSTSQAELYIGFKKDEGAAARAGRKGRVIKDDPRKYPSRDVWGTGGWAGGETGLWELRDEVLNQKTGTKKSAGPSSAYIPKATAGKDAIYVGFNKDELDLRKSGVKGRVIVDDPKKYPGKEDLGPLAGVVGGFAGGEVGLKQFAATGEIRLRSPGEPGPKQFSPLTLAGAVALAGAAGGLLLEFITDAGENAVSTELLQAPIDVNTKYLLLAALGLTGVSGVIVAVAAVVRSLQERLQDSAKDVAATAVFLTVVFLVAKGILDS